MFLQSQRGGHLGDEVLGVGDDALCTQAAPVGQLVGGKVGGVHAVEIHRTDSAVLQHTEGGGHVAGGDGVQGGGHADDGGGLFHVLPHSVLAGVHVP